jgi:hypothetical protein
MYNTNGRNPSVNDMFYNSDPNNVGAYAPRTFGTWPTTFGSSSLIGHRYSMYATADTGAPPTATATRTSTPTRTPTSTPVPGAATSTPTATATSTRTSTPAPGGTRVGLTSVGSVHDTSDSNYITGSRVVTGSAPMSVTSMSVYVTNIDSAPRNQYAMAIYTDAGGAPGSLVAQTANGTLTASAWNTLSVSATLSANTAYWLVYNANGGSEAVDNMVYNSDPSNVGAYVAQPFGAWPNTIGGATLAGQRYSIYASGP